MINQSNNAHVSCMQIKSYNVYVYADITNKKVYYCVHSVIKLRKINHVLKMILFYWILNSIVVAIFIFLYIILILFELFVTGYRRPRYGSYKTFLIL